jgi:ElaB/YqjD/DUF883 family membrane-anchored ribosome-binding protein
MTDNYANTRLREDLAAVMRDAEVLIGSVSDQAGAKSDEARVRIREALDKVKARLGEIESKVSEQGAEAARAADDYVHTHPWQAVGVAAGIGLVVGLLLARR